MDWPQQATVAQTTVRNATTIRKAFKEAFDTQAIVDAWTESHPDKSSMTPQGARDWALAHVNAKRKPIELSLARTYADSYTLGTRVAKARILGRMALKSVSVGSVDWSNWTPGMSSAAALAKPTGGLKRLMDTRKITVSNEVIRTKIDRIGTKLAEGLERGYGPSETAKLINEVIGDPQHALLIARTETSRALSVANRDEYEKNNVQMVEWLVAEPCDECQENADASPIGIDETFPTGDAEPPAHPNCMCALAPYFDDSDLPAAEEISDELEGFDGEGLEDVEQADTGTEIEEIPQEAPTPYQVFTDYMETSEFARYQNFDDRFMEVLGNPVRTSRGGIDPMQTDSQAVKALKGYKLVDYMDINGALREAVPGSQQTQESIKILDKIMAAAPGAPKNFMSYRGVANRSLDDFFSKLKPGNVFKDQAFASTTLEKQFATEWGSSRGQSGKWLIEVENPKGTRGVMLDGVLNGNAGEEAEWLLPRNSRFEVLSIDNDSKVLRVRVLQ